MQLLDRLSAYYGFPSAEEIAFVEKNAGAYSLNAQEAVYNYITENRVKKFGFPDIAFLAKAFKAVGARQSAGRRYIWHKCKDCGHEYAANLMTCPACWKRGIDCAVYETVTSREKPPLKITRFNKPATRIFNGLNAFENEMSCYDCPKNDFSFCALFGNPAKQCSQDDFTNCQCIQCCKAHKARNAALAAVKAPKTVKYGKSRT